jgi:hypothetical protein
MSVFNQDLLKHDKFPAQNGHRSLTPGVKTSGSRSSKRKVYSIISTIPEAFSKEDTYSAFPDICWNTDTIKEPS